MVGAKSAKVVNTCMTTVPGFRSAFRKQAVNITGAAIIIPSMFVGVFYFLGWMDATYASEAQVIAIQSLQMEQAKKFDTWVYDEKEAKLEDQIERTGDAIFVNNADSMFTVETIATGIDPLPFAVTALQNYPNPFNPSTEIVFNMAREGHASLEIFDVQGTRITTLVNGNVPAGPNQVTWNGRDSRGTTMATGVYFYRLVTQDAALTRKMVLLK